MNDKISAYLEVRGIDKESEQGAKITQVLLKKSDEELDKIIFKARHRVYKAKRAEEEKNQARQAEMLKTIQDDIADLTCLFEKLTKNFLKDRNFSKAVVPREKEAFFDLLLSLDKHHLQTCCRATYGLLAEAFRIPNKTLAGAKPNAWIRPKATEVLLSLINNEMEDICFWARMSDYTPKRLARTLINNVSTLESLGICVIFNSIICCTTRQINAETDLLIKAKAAKDERQIAKSEDRLSILRELCAALEPGSIKYQASSRAQRYQAAQKEYC